MSDLEHEAPKPGGNTWKNLGTRRIANVKMADFPNADDIVRQGLLGKPIFKTPLDRHFGWTGLLATAAGLTVAIVSVALGIAGWDVTRLWLYLLGSAMITLVGVQLVIYWVLIRVLEELSQRDVLTQRDMGV